MENGKKIASQDYKENKGMEDFEKKLENEKWK